MLWKRFFKKTQLFWPILILFLISAAILRFYIKSGFPETHDGQSHVARLANFHLAVIDRHFPIRWAPNLNYKFGYPVFNFNYYTPYVLALLPVKLGFDFEASFKIVLFLSLFAGGVFWFMLLRARLGQVAALIGSIFYIVAPYQLVNIYIRGSVGEIVALGLMPAIFYALTQLIEKTSRLWFFLTTLGIGILFLTHNITAVFGTPLLLSYAGVLIFEKKAWQKLLPLFLAFALGIGLTLFFWIPAMVEKKDTNMDQINMSYEYADHFPLFSQLLHSPWQYGLSVSGPDDGMSFELGPFHWLIVFIGVGLFWQRNIRVKKFDYLWLFFGAIFLGTIIFMNQLTLPIWKIMPIVRYIQFPWRLLSFSLLGVAFISAWVGSKKPVLGIILALGALTYTLIVAKPFGWYDNNNYFYYEWPFTSSIKGLNMPKWFDLEKNHRLEVGKIFVLEGQADIEQREWRTQRHLYDVSVDSDEAVIMERTAFFPGWEVNVNGKRTLINYEREDHPGVISFTLPKGKYQIKTLLTENTAARRLGDRLSIVSGLVLVFLLSQGRLFKKWEKEKSLI